MIQQYYYMLDPGLLKTRLSLDLAQIAISLPFGTFFLSSSQRSIPRVLVESAEEDGAFLCSGTDAN